MLRQRKRSASRSVPAAPSTGVMGVPIVEDMGASRRLRSLTQITCLRCGKEAEGQRNKRYCTVACARLAWAAKKRRQDPPKTRGHHRGICDRCGAAFLGHRNKRFCSRQCSLAAYRKAHLDESRRWTAAYRERHPERVKQQERASYPGRKAYQRAWRQQHADRVKGYGRKYRGLYSERANEAQRRSHAKHAAKRRAAVARWQRENPDRHAFNSAARRARVMEAPGSHTYQEWLDLVERYEGRCAYCGSKTDRLTRDHITPLKLGGGNDIANIVPACRTCNARKGMSPLYVFKARLRSLGGG